MFSPGFGQMLMVLFIALLLFGKRLPEVARNLGKGLKEFQSGIKGIQNEVNQTVNSASSYTPPRSAPSEPRPVPKEEQEDDDFDVPKFELPTSAPTPVAGSADRSSGDAEQPNA